MSEKKNTIGRFEIIEKIGEGPIGAVYKALDPVIRRTVAIKVIKLYALEETATFAEVFEKIYRVVRTSTSLNHPNVCIIYDLSEEKKIPFITMEYVEGHDLDYMLQKHHQFKRQELINILQQVCDALDFAHRKGVLHQDLKASNILITPDLRVKITDFGIAGLEEVAITQTKKLLSVAHYISPEQALGERVTPASDLFSLGVVMFQLLSGQLPFPGTSAASVIMMIARDNPVVPEGLEQSGISRDDWDSFFSIALAKNANQRFRSAKEMLEAISAIVPSGDTRYYPYSFSSGDSTGKFEKTYVGDTPTVLIDTSHILEEEQPAESAPEPPVEMEKRESAFDLLNRTMPVEPPPAPPAARMEPEAGATIMLEPAKEVQEPPETVLMNPEPSAPQMTKTAVPEVTMEPKEEAVPATVMLSAQDTGQSPASLPAAVSAPTTILNQDQLQSHSAPPVQKPPVPPAHSTPTVTYPIEAMPTIAPAPKPEPEAVTPTMIPSPKPVTPSSSPAPPSPPQEKAAPPQPPQPVPPSPPTPTPETKPPEPVFVAPPPAMPAAKPAPATGSALKGLLIGAVVVAVIIAIAGILFFFGKKDEEPKKEQIVTPQPVPQPKPVEPKPEPVTQEVTTGKLVLNSDPPGATVSINDVEKGVTPLEIPDLPFGKYVVTVKLKGFTDQQQEIELTAENAVSELAFKMEKSAPVVGTLLVESNPPGAFIVIRNKVVGTTPKKLTNQRAGKYDITLKKDGYRDYTGSIRVRPDETVTFRADLVEIPKPPPPPPPPVKPKEEVKPGMLVTMGPGVTPPKAIKKAFAKYPEAARKQRLEGVVELSILVSETGKILEVKVVKSANPILDQAAVDAVKTWVYEPARKDGVPVKIWWPVAMTFQSGR